MTIRFRHRARFLSGWLLCVLLANGLQAAPPYVDKPTWWDSAERSVPLQEKDNLRDTYQSTRDTSLNTFRLERSDWWFLGPFDAPDGLNTRHRPEQIPRRTPNARFRGKGGEPVEWRSLSENRKDVRGENFIFYFSTLFDLEQPRAVWLVPQHDDGLALWVDGKPFYFGAEKREEGFRSASRINLQAGRHQVFAKLHNGRGRWSLSLDIYTVDPRFVDIMALTQALTHPPLEDDPQWARMAGDLAEKWAEIENYPNAMHWHAERFALLGKRERDQLYRWLDRLLENNPEAAPYIRTFYRMAYENGIEDDSTRLELIQAHLGLLLKAKDALSLREQFRVYRADLEVLAPLEADVIQIRLSMKEGDLGRARSLFRDLMAERPELENNRRFQNLKEDMDKLRETSAQLPMDWDVEGTIRQAARLAEADPDELHRYIRSILRDKSGNLVETEDPNLFRGVRARYVQAFAPYAQGYQEALKEYIRLLARQLNLEREELRRRVLHLSLTASGRRSFDVTRPAASSLRLPPTRGVRPLLVLDTDRRDLEMQVPLMGETWRTPITVGVEDDRNGFAVQNGRTVALFRGGQMLWRNVGLPSQLDLPPETLSAHGQLRPALSGDQVIARVLRGGRFVLTAFSRASGGVEWTWPSDARVLCTNPVVWGRHVLTVTRSPGQIAQYSLAFLNRKTGELEEELPLLVGSYRYSVHRFGGTAEFDHYMPDPQLAGSTLFLQTNSGVVTAVDLDTLSTRWSRRYANADWNQGSGIESLQDRWRHPPAIVGDTAVFGPIDATSLLSVDAATGDLLAQEGTLDWISLHPFGDHLLVIDRDRKAYVLEPDSLKTIKQLPDEGYRALRSLDGGILLEHKGGLEVWGSEPVRRKSRQPLPSGWRALAVTPQGVVMDRPDQTQPVIALGTASSGVEGQPVGPGNHNSPDHITKGAFRMGRNSLYVLSGSAVQKWSGTEKPDWVLPVDIHGDIRQVRLFESGSEVYLVDARRIRKVQTGTGETIQRYPEPGQEYVRLRGANLEGDVMLFAIPRGHRARDGHDILRMKKGQAEVLGRIGRNQGTPLMIANQGRRILTVDRDKLYILERNGGEEKWKTVKTEKIGNQRWRAFRSTDGGYQIDAHPGHVDIVSPDATYQRINTHNWKSRDRNPREVYGDAAVKDGILFWKDSKRFWNAVELQTGRDLTKPLKSSTRPVVIGGQAVGLEMDRSWRSRKLTPRVVKLSSGKGRAAEVIEPSEASRDWREISGERFSFTHRKAVYYLVEPRGESRAVDENPLVIFNPDTRSAQLAGFPDTGSIRDIRVWKNQLWLLRDHDLVRLPFGEFIRLMNGEQTVAAPLPLPASLRVDGVHAEWGPNDMVDSGGGVFAHLDQQALVLAGTARNPAFIRALGRRGIDDRATLHLRNGSAASFVMDKGVDFTLTDLPEGSAFAYTVHPAGDRMDYEIRIPSEGLKAAGFDPLATRDKPERDRRGDLAFDLSIRDPDGTLVFAHAKHPWPVEFPRFFLSGTGK